MCIFYIVYYFIFQYRKDYNFKICHPSLMPFKIVIVDTIEELGNTVKPDNSLKDSDNLGLDTQNV